jgi:FeS assembly SUF system protein
MNREEIIKEYPLLAEKLKTVFDPEIPVDIFELGLIYDVTINPDKSADVKMSLTSPMCPVAGEMPGWVQTAIIESGVANLVRVDLTFDPQWNQEMMTEDAKLALGM